MRATALGWMWNVFASILYVDTLSFGIFAKKSKILCEILMFLYTHLKYLSLCWYGMEKQDPWLRAGCYVAKKYIEQYLSYARDDLSKLLSAHRDHDSKKESLVRALMRKNGIFGFDSTVLKDEFLLDHIGPIKFNNINIFQDLYLEEIRIYRENIQKLHLVLCAIGTYIDDLTQPYVSIRLDEEICIYTKADLVKLLEYMDIPAYVINQTSCAQMSFSESESLPSISQEKITFILTIEYFISTILDPLISRREKSLEYTFNKEIIESIMYGYLWFMDEQIDKYTALLEDDISNLDKKNISNIIRDWENNRKIIKKTYEDQLKTAQNIQELLEPMKLLRESMKYAAYTWGSFSFLSYEYDAAEELIDLARLLLDKCWLAVRLPKSENLVDKLTQYILSYKS